jgi:hypothetical protein
MGHARNDREDPLAVEFVGSLCDYYVGVTLYFHNSVGRGVL